MNMKLKIEGPTPKTIEILDRKTDEHGRTLYLIKWGEMKNNVVEWEPTINLKNQYQAILAFQKNYQNRIMNWNQNVQEYSSTSLISLVNKPKQNVETNWNNVHITNSQPSESRDLSENSSPDPDSKSKPNLDQSPTELPKNIEIQTVAVPNSNSTGKNQKTFKVAIRKKINPKQNMTKNMKCKVHKKSDFVKQAILLSINDIFEEASVWYAIVNIEGEGTRKVLRDWVRYSDPEKLMRFYECQVEQIKKNPMVSH